MKAVLLDTNVLIALFKGDEAVADVLSKYERVLVPTVVLGEFKAGIVLDVKNGVVQRQMLDSFLDSPAVKVVPVDEEATDTYALVYKSLRERGTPIPQNDLWIAVAALDHGAVLFSRDEHFSAVPLLKRIAA